MAALLIVVGNDLLGLLFCPAVFEADGAVEDEVVRGGVLIDAEIADALDEVFFYFYLWKNIKFSYFFIDKNQNMPIFAA